MGSLWKLLIYRSVPCRVSSPCGKAQHIDVNPRRLHVYRAAFLYWLLWRNESWANHESLKRKIPLVSGARARFNPCSYRWDSLKDLEGIQVAMLFSATTNPTQAKLTQKSRRRRRLELQLDTFKWNRVQLSPVHVTFNWFTIWTEWSGWISLSPVLRLAHHHDTRAMSWALEKR